MILATQRDVLSDESSWVSCPIVVFMMILDIGDDMLEKLQRSKQLNGFLACVAE